MTAPEDYIRETSLAIVDRYAGDCVAHACRIAELLRSEQRSPWIGRLRHATRERGLLIHQPLIPQRYAGRGGPAWSTHYVACSGHEVYDPLVGSPIPVEEYSLTVFGLNLAIETHLDVEATEARLMRGDLRLAFQPRSAAELI